MKSDLSEKDIGWAAGIFDGEGTVSIRKTDRTRRCRSGRYEQHAHLQYWVQVSLWTTTKPVAERMVAWFGGGIKRRAPRKGQRRMLYQWRATCQVACSFLRLVRSELIIKDVEADIALALQEVIDRRAPRRGHGGPGGGWLPLSPTELRQRESFREQLFAAREVGVIVPAQV